MVGGCTYEESITVYETNRNNPGVRVLLGGSTVHNAERYYLYFMYDNPLMHNRVALS